MKRYFIGLDLVQILFGRFGGFDNVRNSNLKCLGIHAWKNQEFCDALNKQFATTPLANKLKELDLHKVK